MTEHWEQVEYSRMNRLNSHERCEIGGKSVIYGIRGTCEAHALQTYRPLLL